MSFDLVLFGGTGDLTWRKLMPALFQAFRHGKLPPNGRILAVAECLEQRGHQLAPGEVAGAAEENKVKGHGANGLKGGKGNGGDVT